MKAVVLLLALALFASITSAAKVRSYALTELACSVADACAVANCPSTNGNNLPARYWGSNNNIPLPVSIEWVNQGNIREESAQYFAILMVNTAVNSDKLWFIYDIPVATTLVDRNIEARAVAGEFGKGNVPYKGPSANGNFQILVFPYVEAQNGRFDPTTLSAAALRTYFTERSLTTINPSDCCQKLCFRAALPPPTDRFVQTVRFASNTAAIPLTYTPQFGTATVSCAAPPCTASYELGQWINVTAPLRAGTGDVFHFRDFTITNSGNLSPQTTCVAGSGFCYVQLAVKDPGASPNPYVTLTANYNNVVRYTITRSGTSVSPDLPPFIVELNTNVGAGAAVWAPLASCNNTFTTVSFEVFSGRQMRFTATPRFGVVITSNTFCGAPLTVCQLNAATTNQNAVVTDGPATVTSALTVTITPAGAGVVKQQGEPASKLTTTGINAPTTASATYVDQEVVELLATANPGFRFDGWGNAQCRGKETTCYIRVNGATTVNTAWMAVVEYTIKKVITDGADQPIVVRYTPAGATATITDNTLATTNQTEIKIIVDAGSTFRLIGTKTIGVTPGVITPACDLNQKNAGNPPNPLLDGCQITAANVNTTLNIPLARTPSFDLDIKFAAPAAPATVGGGTVRIAPGANSGVTAAIDCSSSNPTQRCATKIYSGSTYTIIVTPFANSTIALTGSVAVTPTAAAACESSAGGNGIITCRVNGVNGAQGITVTIRLKNHAITVNNPNGLTVMQYFRAGSTTPNLADPKEVTTNTINAIPGTLIELRAIGKGGKGFTTWGNTLPCRGTNPVCRFTAGADGAASIVNVGAAAKTGTIVDIFLLGSGSGNIFTTTPPANAVTSCDAGTNVGSSCSVGLAAAGTHLLSPLANTGSYFVGWADAVGNILFTGTGCVGTGACILSSPAAQVAAHAVFNTLPNLQTFAWTFPRTSTLPENTNRKFETVGESSNAIVCGPAATDFNCTVVFNRGTRRVVGVTPVAPATGTNRYVFNQWVGGSCGEDNVKWQTHCPVSETNLASVGLNSFTLPAAGKRVLQVFLRGRGTGSVVGRNPNSFNIDKANANQGKNINCDNSIKLVTGTPYGCVKNDLPGTGDSTVFVLSATSTDTSGTSVFKGMTILDPIPNGKDTVTCTSGSCTVELFSSVVSVAATFDNDCPNSNEVRCGTTCVDYLSSATNCGRCDSACPATIGTCVAGSCRCKTAGLTYIVANQICVNTNTNDDYCGATRINCRPGASCVGGKCTLGTTPNFINQANFPDRVFTVSSRPRHSDVTKFTAEVTNQLHIQDNELPGVGEGERVNVTIQTNSVTSGRCCEITIAQGSNSIGETRNFAVVRDALLLTSQNITLDTTINSRFQYLIECDACRSTNTTRSVHQTPTTIVGLTITRQITENPPRLFNYRFNNLLKLVPTKATTLA
jgi:hypothetical protein